MERARAPVTKRTAARAGLALLATLATAGPAAAQCTRTFVAKVVAFEQFIWYNRLGAHEPDGLMYALEQDVVSSTGGTASAGNARLRDGKRPRPLVLRVNAGACLQIQFKNLLSPTYDDLGTRNASVHVTGFQLVSTIRDDGSNVGVNGAAGNGLIGPGGSITYTLLAPREGTYLMYSTAQTTGGEGDGGQIAKGLFGAVNVEPVGAEYYRSQLTREEMNLATIGATPAGHPAINYDATYPNTYAIVQLRGRPILRMTKGDTLVHSDIAAVITGPGRGLFADSAFADATVPVYPERRKPFREYTAIFHDEVGLVQAFDSIFDSRRFEYTLHGGRDAFAINYGTGGIGAEILANRFRLGPMRNCNDCKFEEFFLSSWAVGDPAMVVDNPPGVGFSPNNPPPPGTVFANVARFPEDPSNVFHSYLNDHVKIRNLHAGPKEHHIFHLHAHQWLHTPNSGQSNYLDSQAIGPGAGYTYEITYGGAGNRNETPGDAIFHCHFYPHFAQGMWGLWRVHDVFEHGTAIDQLTGKPVAGSRALPDGEIAAGTPIPGVVPLPGYALAPLPTNVMPGFPFYIPGIAGHRPPQPPLDVQPDPTTNTGYRDGGLRRHVVFDGQSSYPLPLLTKDFHKDDVTLGVNFLPETGTPGEVAAMNFHAQPGHATYLAGQWSTAATFETNGLGPKPGAPYADPCGIDGVAMGNPRQYRAVAFQLNPARYNKAEWRYGQHRMFALWNDWPLYASGAKAPEPLFFRAHDNDCITYHLVNLIPKEYNLDDFQVRTPTDIVGQHIHLVKFDVTSSDGAANGWNYEDGSLSPQDVVARIAAIRAYNGCSESEVSVKCPTPENHPELGVLGAQETLQRWWVDPIPRDQGTSRLGTVFTHDHFGPSTHQQTGLYAALVPEDQGTRWRDPETGTYFGNRDGPTSWRADILYRNARWKNFREFNLQLADFTLAYGREGFIPGGPVLGAQLYPINPPGKDEVGLPYLLRPPLARGGPGGLCPNGIDTPPCPEIVSADDPGTMTINYRNEPLALRVPDPASNAQAAGVAGDLSYSFSSQRTRADARLNTFGPYGQRPGELPRDPFTPLLRVYEDDRIVVRSHVGAHEEGHNFNIRGTRWLFEPLDPESGWRNSQMFGISEFHEFFLDPLLMNPVDTIADFLYEAAAVDDRWNGTWGLLRMYRTQQGNLLTLDEDADGSKVEATSVSLSFEAAKARESAGAPMKTPDGYASSPLPDPADPSSWEGTVSSLGGSTSDPAMKTSLVTTTDSLEAGYGKDPQGGVDDYEYFEWEVDTNTERVATTDTTVTTKGYTYSGTVDAGADQPAELRSSQSFSPGLSGSVPLFTSIGPGFWGVCPWLAPVRYFDISAVDAKTFLPGGKLVYNSRQQRGGPLNDTTAILYVYTADLRAGLPSNPEPLVLRANAGECILVRLRNLMETPLLDLDGWNTLPPIVDRFNANQVRPSPQVGLHPQLVAYDAQHSDGSEVGLNRNTTVPPGKWRYFQWYAGDITRAGRTFRATPIEFGATNLMSSDPIKHSNKGAIGALVIEPRKSEHYEDPGSRARATIVNRDGSFFRELVLLYQDDVNLRFGNDTTLQRFDCEEPYDTEEEQEFCEETGGSGFQDFARNEPVPNLAEAEDPEDSGQKAFNYRTEPMWFRMGFAPNAELGLTRQFDFSASLTDAQVGARPQTPILQARAGQAVRVRVLEPGGHARNHVFQVHGHVWEELPYEKGSLRLGSNPLSEWKGARDGHGPSNHHDILLLNGAGGRFGITGEYLYRDQPSFQFDGGLWGLLKVVPRRFYSVDFKEPAEATVKGSSDSETQLQSQGSTSGCTIDPHTSQTVCSQP
jgi:manganese oxidase